MPDATKQGRRVAVIRARWHANIVDRAAESFVADWREGQADLFDVPGVFEIPLKAQKLARSGQYDAIVGIGFVVDGGIYRHDFVSAAVVDGLMRVQLDEGVPVFSVVLTPHHFQSGDAAQEAFFESHFVRKGQEAAAACRETLSAGSDAVDARRAS